MTLWARIRLAIVRGCLRTLDAKWKPLAKRLSLKLDERRRNYDHAVVYSERLKVDLYRTVLIRLVSCPALRSRTLKGEDRAALDEAVNLLISDDRKENSCHK